MSTFAGNRECFMCQEKKTSLRLTISERKRKFVKLKFIYINALSQCLIYWFKDVQLYPFPTLEKESR